MGGVDQVALVLHAEEERIEGRQEADYGPFELRPPQRGQILAKHRADSPTHIDRGQLRLEARPNLAGVRRRHVGPEGEVAHRRRAVRPEIPPEELEFRLLRRQVGPFRKPLLRTNEGCLGTAGRTETGEPPKAREEDNPIEGQHLARDSKPGRRRCAAPTAVRLLDGLDAEGGGDPLGNLAARQRSIEAIPHRFDQSVDGVDRDFRASQPSRRPRVPPFAAAHEHRKIPRRDEVERPSNAPRLHESSVLPQSLLDIVHGKAPGPRPQRNLRGGQHLGLCARHVARHTDQLRGPRRVDEMVTGEPEGRNLIRGDLEHVGRSLSLLYRRPSSRAT